MPARGTWAFGYPHASALDAAAAERLWSAIPLDTDIAVTHTPAYNHCDLSPKWGAAGCPELRKALWRVRPRLHVCGHVHEARGADRTKWKLDLPFVRYAEQETEVWTDPGAGQANRKMSLIDLTGRKGTAALDNDGAGVQTGLTNAVRFTGGKAKVVLGWDSMKEESDSEYESLQKYMTARKDHRERPSQREHVSRLDKQHMEAVAGRLGRKETCFVNAAIMARSFGNGPKRFNKPIVVDIDLPIDKEEQL